MRYKAMPASVRSSGPARPEQTHGSQARERHRVRDWVATVPIVLLVASLVVPFVATSASTRRLVAPSPVTPGSAIRASGSGFGAGERVELAWDGGLLIRPHATVKKDGTFSIRLVVPSSTRIGLHRLGALVAAGTDPSAGGPQGAGSPPSPVAEALIEVVAVEPSRDPVTPGPSTDLSTPVPTPGLTPSVSPTQLAVPSPSGTATGAPTPTVAPTATPALAPAPTAVSSATPSTGPAATPPPTLVPTSTPSPTAASSTGDYLLIDRADLMRLPTSGSAWTALLGVADGALGTADLCDQNNKHAVRTFGVALVYARTGTTAYRTKARDAIMTAIKTVHVGCTNAILSLGRQLGAYVLAADLIGLSGSDDSTFRTWLSAIRTKDLGGHGRWRSLEFTAGDSSNNWGAFAQASIVAADAYLGDRAGLAADWSRFRGFTGDASTYKFPAPSSPDLSWTCGQVWTPMQRCSGDSRDGAITEDAWRAGAYPAISLTYVQETMQGLSFAAELLTRSGYAAWPRLAPLADFATRWGVWNASSVGRHLPYWYSLRLGRTLPELAAGTGRLFGYTDWLYAR